MKALSIRQPWAWLIVNGFKDIENRTWPTGFRGEFLVHAGKGLDLSDYNDAWHLADGLGITLPHQDALERGGIVGRARICGCVQLHHSPWFFGPWGFVLYDQAPLPFQPCRGALGFFDASDAAVTKETTA